jgi:enoyl-CoA hydratase/carnithine racemase
MMFTGDLITAQRAAEMGMINSVAADGELMSQVMAMAEKLATAPTAAIGQIKRLMDASATTDCKDQLEL